MENTKRHGTALVTGGNGGIGAAVAVRFAETCDTVVITYFSNRDTADKTLAKIRALGAKAEAVQLDLREEDAVAEMVNGVAERHDGIRLLVTAHGPFIHMLHVSKLKPSLFRETMESDTFAAYNVIQAAIPHLRKTKGAIVTMGTAAMGRYASTDILSVAPKIALQAITTAVAVEEGRFGVRANMIGVGLLKDGMFQALVDSGSFDQAFLDKSISQIPMKRFGHSAEIADAVVFLTSEKASYITGQTLMVDGGYAA